MGSIIVTSGYGGNTDRPFVQIESPVLDRPLQLSAEEARQLGMNILQAAENAESDGFIVNFLRNINPDLTTPQIAEVLSQFREYREKGRISK